MNRLRSHRNTKKIDEFPGIDRRVPRLRASHGARRGSSVFLEISVVDPPRGRPVGGGGTYHNRGMGGLNPHHSPRKISMFMGNHVDT